MSGIVKDAPRLATLRVIVVDREPLARSLLIRLCNYVQDVEIVAQAESGAAALAAVRAHRADLMLLDVDLPDMSGFELMRALHGGDAPAAIIVTADAAHALTAFDAGAVDFLVKPVRAGRFGEAMRRARDRSESSMLERMTPATQMAWTPVSECDVSGPPPRLTAERERRLYLLDPERVGYIESYGNYVRIWSGTLCYISRDCVKALALLLAPAGFVRIQRSKLVNLRAVSYIERPGHGIFVFILGCGTRLESTPTYRAHILAALYPAHCSKRWAIKSRATLKRPSSIGPVSSR